MTGRGRGEAWEWTGAGQSPRASVRIESSSNSVLLQSRRMVHWPQEL